MPACPPFAILATERLSSTWDGVDVAKAWSAWADEDERPFGTDDSSKTALHITTSDGLTPDPRVYDLRAKRQEGVWKLASRSQPMKASRPNWTAWKTETLSPAAAAQMDKVLVDACLWRAPRFLNGAVPLKTGLFSHCVDGPLTQYDMRDGARRWGGVHECWVLGPPGRARAILMNAAFHREGSVMDDELGGNLGKTADTIDPPR